MKNAYAKVKALVYGISVVAIISNCKRYIGNLTNNTNFTLDPTPAEAATKLGELESAEGRMRSGDRTAKPDRDQALEWMQRTMSTWVDLINGQAQGDTTKLETTGMEFVKPRTPRVAPKKVARCAAKNGAQSGLASLSWTGDKEADFFEVQSSNDNLVWNTIEVTRSNRYQIEGLVKKQEYFFRVCGKNKAGVGPYSPVANLVVA